MANLASFFPSGSSNPPRVTHLNAMQTHVFAQAFILFTVVALPAWASGAQSPAPQSTTAVSREHTTRDSGLPKEFALHDGTRVERTTPKPGDICISCNHPVGDNDAVFLIRGHRLPIHLSEIQSDLDGQLSQFLARLEPQSALFQVSERNPARSMLWLLAGSYVLMALIFAALSSQRALMKGYSPSLWLALGLVFHVFAYVTLLLLPGRTVEAPAGVPKGLKKIAATHQPVACPGCGELNHPSATKCVGCGGTLVARISSEVSRTGLRAG
jgi:hypothetical protein